MSRASVSEHFTLESPHPEPCGRGGDGGGDCELGQVGDGDGGACCLHEAGLGLVISVGQEHNCLSQRGLALQETVSNKKRVF